MAYRTEGQTRNMDIAEDAAHRSSSPNTRVDTSSQSARIAAAREAAQKRIATTQAQRIKDAAAADAARLAKEAADAKIAKETRIDPPIVTPPVPPDNKSKGGPTEDEIIQVGLAGLILASVISIGLRWRAGRALTVPKVKLKPKGGGWRRHN